MQPARWPNFIPHSRVRSTRRDNLRGCRRRNISIHAPVWGATGAPTRSARFTCGFQSTLPMWGATHRHDVRAVRGEISIHAPRVGSDTWLLLLTSTSSNFNPRSPCGERRMTSFPRASLRSFQSTLPVWGATSTAIITGTRAQISIHAPRVGSDQQSGLSLVSRIYFNPRSPCGERRGR